MEKCINFISEKNSNISSQKRKNQHHVLPPSGRLGPATFWKLVMTHLAYLNICTLLRSGISWSFATFSYNSLTEKGY